MRLGLRWLHAAFAARARAIVATSLVACLALAPLALFAEVAVPPLSARVTDLTGTFSVPQRDALERELAAIETRTGSQFAVLLLPTTQPETIEQFALRVVEAWQLGKKDKDNGLLLLVAKDDRKVRIEVGYGLEGDIPDAIARRVIGETLAPRFQAGDFAGGVTAAVQRLAGLVEGGTPARSGEARPRGGGKSPDLPLALLVGVIVGGSILRRIFGRFFGGLTTAGLAGVGTWLVTGIAGFALVAALFVFVLTLAGFGSVLGTVLGGRRGGGFGGGGFGGGGGFSGGGGGFGGGGASGSW